VRAIEQASTCNLPSSCSCAPEQKYLKFNQCDQALDIVKHFLNLRSWEETKHDQKERLCAFSRSTISFISANLPVPIKYLASGRCTRSCNNSQQRSAQQKNSYSNEFFWPIRSLLSLIYYGPIPAIFTTICGRSKNNLVFPRLPYYRQNYSAASSG